MIRPDVYEVNKGISQSDLKLLKTNIQEFYKRCILGEGVDNEKDRKRYFDVGDMTDVMLLQPELKGQFYCMENISLGDKFKVLMDELWKAVYKDAYAEDGTKIKDISNDVNDYMNYVLDAAKAALYYYNPEKPDKPWSRNLETIQTEVKGTGSKYFQALADANGKIVVNVQDWNTAAKCLEKIRTSNNKYIAEIVKYLDNAGTDDQANAEIQVLCACPFFGRYMDKNIKGLPDLVIINHKEKWIWPLDLKTSKSLLSFPVSYRSFKYGKQGAFYTLLLQYQPAYEGYTIKNFGFIVVNSNPDVDDRAEYYEMTAKELHVQINGMDRPDGSRVRGLKDDFEDLQWHETNNEWCRYPENAITDVFALETIGAPDVEVQAEPDIF